MIIFLLVANLYLDQLGNKPWCSVLPNTTDSCHAIDKTECDGKPVTYCIWNNKDECEKNKLYSDEKCEENKNETTR